MPHLATPKFGRLGKTAVTAVVAGATVVALTVPAGAAPSSTGGKPRSTKYGKTLRLNNTDVDRTVIRVRVAAAPKTEPDKLLPSYEKRPKKGRLVYVHVSLTGVKGTTPTNPLYFYIIPAKGKPVGADLGLIKHQIDSDYLKKGKKDTGNVAFHLKPGMKIRKVMYSDVFSKPAGYWTH